MRPEIAKGPDAAKPDSTVAPSTPIPLSVDRPAHITRRSGLVGIGALAGGLVLSGSLAGALRAADLVAGEQGGVSAVTSGHTLTLEDGLNVRLAGITAPSRSEPWGREAREGLSALLRGRTVQLSYGGDPRDRYDRALAQLHTLTTEGTPDLWIQEDLVRLGLARVYTWPKELIDHVRLYKAEGEARRAGRGLWGHPAYAVRGPEPNALAQHVDSLQLVEGIVTSTADIRGRAYLNFGADYRTDFTVAVARKHRKRFKGSEPVGDPVLLEGARIRVRGWVELINGPMIWASHPARIEVLS
ncbi:MAG: thermonuclease family protein [Litorimonas sp.]